MVKLWHKINIINIYNHYNNHFVLYLYSILHPDYIRYRLYKWWRYLKPRLLIYLKSPYLILFYLRASWKYVISFSIGWCITNGWAYVFAVIGVGWFKDFALWYIGFIWLPTTPEKIITIPLSAIIHKWLWKESNETASKFGKTMTDLIVIGI